MRVVVAMDSFKGSLTSLDAGNAVKEAFLRVDPTGEVTVKPLADGGEGTVAALTAGRRVRSVTCAVKGPLGRPVDAPYCILPESGTAILEMASAAGLTLIPEEERNPLETSTYGVGQLIRDAIHRGCRRFIVGIGGSATNDGGTGMLSALGFSLLDENDQPISLGAKGLQQLRKIKTDEVLPQLRECVFQIACDVGNPLCGENGCSAVFAPQKGGTPEMIRDMDGWLKRFADIAKTVSEYADENIPGTGAAGGLGFAFLAFTNAQLKPGIDILLEAVGIEDAVKTADLVVTGEGRLDAQTVMGKAPIGVARIAKKHKKPVIAFCGCVAEGAKNCNDHGIDAYFPILRGVTTLEQALNTENARRNLTNTAEQVFRLLHTAKSK